MLKLKDRSLGVPDKFVYVHAEDGFESRGINWWECWNLGPTNIVDHRKGNGYPPISPAEFDHQLCQKLPPQWCEHDDAEQGSRGFVNTRLNFHSISEGIKAYLAFPFGNAVSQEEANRRARICSGCYMRVQPQGCGACVKIAQLITGELARKKTIYDSHLVNKACAICSCPTQSLVHFSMSLLEKPEVDSQEKQDAYPIFCWRKRTGSNYQPAAT